MFKKIISLLAAIAILASLGAGAVFAADRRIVVGNVSGFAGDTVRVPVTIENNPGIWGMDLTVSYDMSALKLKDVENGEIFDDSALTKGNFESDSYRLSYECSNLENVNGSGMLAELIFEIKSGAEEKTYDITASYKSGDITNVDEEKVEFELVNGSVTINEKPKADITVGELESKTLTYDGRVNSLTVMGKLPAGASVTYENNNQTDVGEYDVTATIKADGYNDKVLTAKLVINPKNLTVSGLKAENKTYDGTDRAALSGGEIKGAVSGDDVSAAMPKEGKFAKTDAAKGIAVSFDEIKLTGEKAKNYTLTQPTGLKADIAKAPLTVKANDLYIVKGQKVELSYTLTGELFGSDKLTGALSTKADGTKSGEFAITQGTLKATANYDVKFEGGKVYVSDKKVQNIAVSEIGEKTYGDAAFKLEVTPDAEAKLNAFTFESDNAAVAAVADDGTVTLIGAGEANIKVSEAGNAEYAPFTKTVKIVVNKKAVTVTELKLDEKTAVLSGLLEADTEVKLDFSKLLITLGDAVDETTSNAVVTGFALTGAKSENYAVTTESVNATVKNENTVTITATADKGTVTGAGTYLKGSSVTLKAAANSGYKFTGWFEGETSVSSEAEFTFTAEGDREITAKFKKRSSGGGSSSSTSYTIKFDTEGGSDVSSIKVKKGQKIGTIEAPKKDGYVFTGWYADEKLEKQYDDDAEVTASMTLYAGWKVDPKRQIVLAIGKKNADVFGEKKANDVAPIIKNERTMLPARFVAEALGATVEWNGETKTVTITSGETVIVITIDSDKATVNGKEVKLDSPAFIENDRTYTPIRFIAEELGASVEWNEDTEEVTITK